MQYLREELKRGRENQLPLTCPHWPSLLPRGRIFRNWLKVVLLAVSLICLTGSAITLLHGQ